MQLLQQSIGACDEEVGYFSSYFGNDPDGNMDCNDINLGIDCRR